jgi:UDP-2-acetamido-3-amino-2,3-dideoxy-glucuronate N-acetyltransferase
MKKNIAVIGTGYWGKNLVRNFAELGALRVICDTDMDKLNHFKTMYPEILTTTSFKEVLENGDIKGVVISTPAALHYKMAKEALLNDKAVFVEKPLSLRIEEGKELVEIAEERGNILMVGHILHYHPAVLKLQELVNRGELGKIQYIYSNRLNLGKFRTEENILWSFAPHDISVILMLLREMPLSVAAHGSSYLNKNVADVTLTTLDFPSGVRAHIFVSWLHPYKEQKLVVVGDKKMAVFDDISDEKLLLYPHEIEWVNRIPVPHKKDAETVELETEEPLKAECQHFLDCISSRETPRTDGREGLRVLEVLQACQESLERMGEPVSMRRRLYFAHPTAVIDEPCEIGEGTKIWHFSHIMSGAKIGKGCTIGQNVMIAPEVSIGNNVKIQNNVSVFEGVIIEDDIFLGPSMVFTNVTNPRSFISRKDEFKKTVVKKGATIGANATIICGNTIGKYAFIGAGAVVTKDAPDYALVVGNPARIMGWMCECGNKLNFSDNFAVCKCGKKYKKLGDKVVEIK